jgi:hypothetical protein
LSMVLAPEIVRSGFGRARPDALSVQVRHARPGNESRPNMQPQNNPRPTGSV